MDVGLDVGLGTGVAVAVATCVVDSAYLYWGVLKLSRGYYRLGASVPVLASYVFLPLMYDRSSHMLPTGLFFWFFTWVSAFKVLLLCWDKGPGSEAWALESIVRFGIVLHFPIRISREGRVVKQLPATASWWEKLSESQSAGFLALRSCIKLVIMSLTLPMYAYRSAFPVVVTEFSYSLTLYLFLTFILEAFGAVASTRWGIHLEPHFNKPFLASSLEDFWARRWNILVSSMLREAVYEPVTQLITKIEWDKVKKKAAKSADSTLVQNGDQKDMGQANHLLSTGSTPSGEAITPLRQRKGYGSDAIEASPGVVPKSRLVPSKAARFLAALAAFFVSGIMHEWCLYWMVGQASGELIAFFTLHGLATGLQVAAKPYLKNRLRLPAWLSILLTLSFTFATSVWLFYPPFIRGGADVQGLSELSRMLGLQLDRGVWKPV